MSADQGRTDRLPPYNREAEQSVLGSMLRENSVINDVLRTLRDASYFYTDAHQKIFQAIITLYDKGHPVDLVTLANFLHEQKYIEDIGGPAYLAELWDAAPTAANAEYYARIVRDKGVIRALIHANTEILRDAYDQAMPADELLEMAERRVLEIAEMGATGDTITLYTALQEAFQRIDARSDKSNLALSGVPSGFLDLDEKTAGFQTSELIIIAARPSVGKCLAFDSEITLADGSVSTIEEIYHRQKATLLTLKDSWQFGWTEPSAFVDDGIKPVYRVTTRLGKQVEATLAHPFLTINGWKKLSLLQPGNHIAVPRKIEAFGQEEIRDCEVKLLAYFIGDGSLTRTNPTFTNGNLQIQTDFLEAVNQFGGVTARKEDCNGKRTPSFCVRSDRETVLGGRSEFATRLKKILKNRGGSDRALAHRIHASPAIVCLWKQGVCVPEETVFEKLCQSLEVSPIELAPNGFAAIRKNGKNPVTRWLIQHGLWNKTAHQKTIPEVVFRLKRVQLALFLNRLFATDGWATVLTGGNAQLGYCTVHEKLARQIQHLLLRFEIISSLRQRKVKYKDQQRVAWQLDITDRLAIQTFIKEIGIFGKEEALASVEKAIQGRNYQTNCDLIPLEIWERLKEAKGQESWASIARRAGFGKHANIHVGKRSPSRKRLLQLANTLENDPLRRLAQSEVYWDRIESIEFVGYKQVYDLTIPETHNFVANDICVHNTAFALNIARNVVTGEDGKHDGLPIFFVSLEQSRTELAERLLCCHSRVDSHKLRKGHLSHDDFNKITEAGEILSKAKLFIDDTPGQGMLRIAANARRLKAKADIKMVVIDYLQLIEPDNKRDSRQEQVAAISRRLKFLARELHIPVIALAQLNRGTEDRQDHRPRLSDLRESGSIEQDADTVMLLHRPDYYEPGQQEGVIEVIIGKQRNGPTGEVTLSYIKQFMRFENFAVEPPFSYGD